MAGIEARTDSSPLARYSRQNAGVSSTSSVNTSSRPRIIAKLSTQVANAFIPR